MLKAVLALALTAGLGAQAAPPPAPAYAEGQVWEYRTRPGDDGSLLKIQRIEPWPAGSRDGRVFHISIIGVRLGGRAEPVEMQHLPVSQASLDASVTRLSGSTAAFPSPDEGLAMWREAEGGVFTVPVAEVVETADQAMRLPG